jgi:Tfp pilus assembly protein PilV
MKPHPGPERPRVRIHGAEGVTVVEVMIAGVILVVSGIAVLGLLDSASRNNYRAAQSQVVNDQLQQEMEKVKRLPYDQLALTAAPTQSTDPANPNSRVTGTTFNVNKSGAANYEDLAVNGGADKEAAGTLSGGTVDPGPTSFQSGDVKGKVYRYVTWEQDPSCGNCADEWQRHVVVAVTLDQTAAGGVRAYQELQGNVSNPSAGLDQGPGPGSGGNDETPWTFWLTDTPCDSSSRQAITGDHNTHNTLGQCSAGMKTGDPGPLGANAGAPDLMFTQAAPLNPDFPSDQQPLYDYATDVEPAQNPGLDKGLQMNTPTANGCLLNTGALPAPLNILLELPITEAHPQLEVHKWVSPAIPTGFSDVVLDGTGVLNLWTQTINGGVYGGKVCAWLFVRTAAGADVPAVNLDLSGNPTYFTYSQATWPNNGWTEIHVPLHFAEVTLPPTSRLGLAIGVEKPGTPSGSGLQFMYDHPSFDSRLQVDTRSLLPAF